MTTQIESKGIIYAKEQILLPSHMNFGTLLLNEFLNIRRKYLIDGETGEQIRHDEMAQKIVNTAAALIRLGIKKGEVVAICSENRIEFMITTVAVLCSGATLTFLNAAYSKDEMIHSSNISKPKYIFFSPKAYSTHYENIKNNKDLKGFFVFGKIIKDQSFEKFTEKYVDINSFRPVDFYGRAQTAIILYSSGTTGLPKGVKLSHVNCITTAYQTQPSSRDLVTLVTAPWCNTMGLLCTTDALLQGKTVVFVSKFTEELYLSTIEKYKVGFLMIAPPIAVILCKSTILKNYDVSSVKILNSGGAPLAAETITEVKKRFPNLSSILQAYGMTECTGAICRELEFSTKLGSVGKIVEGIIIKVVDIDTQQPVGPGVSGEICVKGLVLFDGYIGRQLEEELDDEGFFKTGDIAYYDENGYFFIVDRLKELIKYKAWQVSPSELEAVILQHPAVKDVGVVGLPDLTSGELPLAFVVKKPGANVTDTEIIEFVASKVSPWKKLRGGVKFITEVPKTGSGKILRRILLQSVLKPINSKL